MKSSLIDTLADRVGVLDISAQCARCARNDPQRTEAMRRANVELERVPATKGRWMFQRHRYGKPGTFRKARSV